MKVSKSSSGVLSSGGAVVASDLTVDGTTITVNESANLVGIGTSDPGAKLEIQDTTTGSANTGGSLRLSANDGAPMGDSHRLGVIEFTGAEDNSNTQVVGARIEALTDAAWTNVENGCALYFYTTDADQSQTNVLKIDSNAKSTFSGNVQVNGNIDLTGSLSFDGSGALITSIDTDLSSVSGSDDTLASAKAIGAQLDTKSPTTGHSSIATVGTITTGVWQGTAIANAYVADLPTSKITSGTFADGRISSSSVVQHQGDITSVGTLTALQVDQINANASTLTITDSTDTDDLCTISVGTHGATTIATVDDDAAAADLTLDVDGDIVLDSAEGKWRLKKDGSTKLKIDHSSGGDITIENGTQDKDLIFAGDDNGSAITALTLDMSEAGAAAFNSTVTATGFIIGSASISEAELEIIDGATVTTAELNLLDGDTSVGGSVTIADSDGFIVNDGGTTKLIPASDLKTYAGGGGGSAADDSNLILHMQVFA